MITLADLRSYALALPDVVEQPHFRLPAFRVGDKLLAHLERRYTHAIVCWRNRAPKRLVAQYDRH